MADAAMQSAYRRAVARTGELVQVVRVTGLAPNVTTTSVSIMANVQGYMPDGTDPTREGYSPSKADSITETMRKVVLVAADLAAAGFPTPVQKNDKVILADGTRAAVTAVDAHKRQLAGAIELTISEVS